MILIWILLGFGFLFILQRAVFLRHWNDDITVTFRFSERAVTEGETADLSERVENRKLLPLPNFGFRYTLIQSFTSLSESRSKAAALQRRFALLGRRAVTNRVKIEGLSRGVYSIDNVNISSTDLFYVTSMECPIKSGSSRLIVYPAKVSVQKIAPAARLILGALIAKRTLQEDPFALKAIRPYEIYDSPRIINWKASAKTGELKVNLFENTTDEALLFLLDMSGGGEKEREELIRIASSLSLFFLRRGVSVSLMANGRDCISGKPIRVRAGSDSAHQITVDENLALIKLTLPVTEPFGEFLSGLPKDSINGALPVVLSADRTGAARGAFLNAPEVRGGFFLSVSGDGSITVNSGHMLTNRSEHGREVRL